MEPSRKPVMIRIENISHLLYRATVNGDWKILERLLDDNPEAIYSRITPNSGTVLHLAIATNNEEPFLTKLFARTSLVVLRMTTEEGDTALHHAASFGNLEAAKLLVEKDPELPNFPNKKSLLPLHEAAKSAQREVFTYLFVLTKGDVDPSPFEGDRGTMLVKDLVTHGLCDLALVLVKEHFHLAIRPESLFSIACHPSNFYRGSRLERATYKLMNANKKLHDDSIELVMFICHKLQMIDPNEARVVFQSAAKEAARNGIHEIIEEIIFAYPTALVLEYDDPEISIFHMAVKYRQHKVFNLIFQMSSQKDAFLTWKDRDGNTILHIAASLSPSHRLNLAHGAALQMQQELLWYKAVENAVPAWSKNYPNNAGTVPHTMFTEQHRGLVKEAESWIKDTANSCTIATALISTIAFAASITVPGGTNSETGFPIFSKNSYFGDFAIFNALSLFSSITSLLMFLSLLTGRYAEHDFWKSLPVRLIIGLVTMIISIFSLMISFGTIVYLVYIHKGKEILQLFLLLGLLPGVQFFTTQLPLLKGLFDSTFSNSIVLLPEPRNFFQNLIARDSSGIFRKQGKDLLL